MLAAPEQQSGTSLTVLVILLLVGSTIYGAGYLTAVARRANSDYKKTKAGLPAMRKAFWSAWWNATKVVFWVFVAGALLVSWVVRDVRNADADTRPTPSVSPSHTKKAKR